jgi:predicted phage terminase large subunit-like protein
MHAIREQADTIIIEDKNSGTQLVQDLQRERNVPIPIPFKPEGDKVVRLCAQSAKIEAGHVLLPQSAPWLEDFKTEVLLFPHGRHDDQVDSMSQFLAWHSGRLTLFEADFGYDRPKMDAFMPSSTPATRIEPKV